MKKFKDIQQLYSDYRKHMSVESVEYGSVTGIIEWLAEEIKYGEIVGYEDGKPIRYLGDKKERINLYLEDD